jgi:hypothetical protein
VRAVAGADDRAGIRSVLKQHGRLVKVVGQVLRLVRGRVEEIDVEREPGQRDDVLLAALLRLVEALAPKAETEVDVPLADLRTQLGFVVVVKRQLRDREMETLLRRRKPERQRPGARRL